MIMISLWTVSIIINVIMILKFAKKEKSNITYGDLFSFFMWGIIIAPSLTGVILIAEATKLYNKLIGMNIMGRIIYRFK